MITIDFNRLRHTTLLWLPVTVAVLFVFTNTTPDRVGPQGVTFFFGLLYVFFSLSLNMIWLVLARFYGHGRLLSMWRTSYSFVYGFIPTIALALESLGQLILRDIIIFIGLAALIGFYIVKRAN